MEEKYEGKMEKIKEIDAIIFDWIGTLYQFGEKGLFDYSEKVLKELHPNYKLAVISRATSESIEKRLNQILKMNHYIDFFLVEKNKTKKQFIECMKRLNVKAEKTLIVGDEADTEIKIGNELGCKTAWIQNGKYSNVLPNEKTGEPTIRINSVEDLLEIL